MLHRQWPLEASCRPAHMDTIVSSPQHTLGHPHSQIYALRPQPTALTAARATSANQAPLRRTSATQARQMVRGRFSSWELRAVHRCRTRERSSPKGTLPMRRTRRNAAPKTGVLVAALAVGVIVAGLAGPASAKGLDSASITGPGLDEPVEWSSGHTVAWTELWFQLLNDTQLWSGPESEIVRAAEAPSGQLGPSYIVAWVSEGPPDQSVEERTIRQEVYPDADGGPVVHTPPQPAFNGWPEGIGWIRASDRLRHTLNDIGVTVAGLSAPVDIPVAKVGEAPATAPAAASDTGSETDREGSSWNMATVVLALAGGLAAIISTRRLLPRPSVSPTAP